MRHLKSFDRVTPLNPKGVTLSSNIFEAVIIPKEIERAGRFGTFEDVLDYARKIDIDIVGYGEFYESLSEADKKTSPKRGGSPFFALLHPERKKPMFVLDNPDFWRIPIFGEIVNDVVSHELIHAEQVRRSDGVKYILPSPNDLGKYFSDKNEVMAFSWTIANELRKNGRDKERAIAVLKSLKSKSNLIGPMSRMVDDIYKNCDEKTINRYHKYIYMYLEEFYKDEKKL